jgi:hypothetical protein
MNYATITTEGDLLPAKCGRAGAERSSQISDDTKIARCHGE